MKCLREVFLKQSNKKSPDGSDGHEFLKLQIMKDVERMKANFLSLMQEFEISRDIKGDYCEFASKRIDLLFEEVEQQWRETITDIKNQIQQKLLQDFLSKVDEFDSHF